MESGDHPADARRRGAGGMSRNWSAGASGLHAHALLGAAVASVWLLGDPAQATSQGPVADGPYVGTLPCADCAGIRTTLTLYTMGGAGAPLVYRMTATYLGTSDGDRTEERLGPWMRVGTDAGERVRIDPYDEVGRQSFRRANTETLVLLGRDEAPIATQHNLRLERTEAATAARLEPPRTLFRGTLKREADRLMLEPCHGGATVRVHDVSPEVVITAAITDFGFDTRDSLYLEAYGTLRDGELMIDRLNRAGTEMGCPTDSVGFRAQGNEPGWSLVSNRTGVRFTTQDGVALNAPPLPLSWRWPGGRPDRAEARFTTSTEGSALTAVLTPRICRDTMADAVYGFAAVVRVARPAPATEFTGCAFLGSESLP